MEELSAPNEKLLRSPTFLEKHGKTTKWLALCFIILAMLLSGSSLLLQSKKSTIVPIQPTPTPISTIPTITSKLDPTANWQIYRNEKYGFEVKYPEDTIIKERDFSKDNLISFSVNFGQISNNQLVMISITNEGMLGLVEEGMVVISRKEIVVGRIKGSLIVGQDQKDGSTIKSIILLTKNQKLYQIIGSGKVFDQILSSFKFTEKNIKTGKVEINYKVVEQNQKLVDNGNQPWQLNPIMVLSNEMTQYGFNEKDYETLANIPSVDDQKKFGTEITNIQVEMTHKNETYIITLVQPVIGIGKIWTISEISLKEKDTRNTKIYQNTTLGFQLTLPNESWYLPAVTDNDPHLYANQECANSERPNCAALEIQNHDSKFSQGPDATLNVLKADGQNPMKLSYLIQGATVIKSNAPGPAEGWGYKYDIFFQAANKRFLIFTNDAALEKSILPTFELTN